MSELDPYGILSGNGNEAQEIDENDITLLEFEFRSVYRQPFITLAIEELATVSQV